MSNIKTKVISAFPGTGKTYFYKNAPGKVLDSDSSNFSWKEKGVRNPDFPANYIKHIKENIGKADYILVSSHKDVRKALTEAKIDFVLVYPDMSLKKEYLERYEERGSPESFINLLDDNWDNWIYEMEEQDGCRKIVLEDDEYLADVINLM